MVYQIVFKLSEKGLCEYITFLRYEDKSCHMKLNNRLADIFHRWLCLQDGIMINTIMPRLAAPNTLLGVVGIEYFKIS